MTHTITKRLFKVTTTIITLYCLSECTYHDLNNLVDCSSNSILATVTDISNPTSCSASNGSFTVSVLGGKDPYHFRLNGGALLDNEQFSDLTGGTYTVTVVDAQGCQGEVATTLQAPDADISFTAVTIPDSGCTKGNGSFTIQGIGSNAPFQYKFSETSFSSANTFTGLKHGGYQVSVRDASGCVIIASVSISKAESGVSYAAEISDIIKNNCAVSQCHISGAQSPDLSAYKGVKNNSASVKSLTTSKFMPPSGSQALTAEQIAKIACWVEDGAKQN
jgi:hypothetical protein